MLRGVDLGAEAISGTETGEEGELWEPSMGMGKQMKYVTYSDP